MAGSAASQIAILAMIIFAVTSIMFGVIFGQVVPAHSFRLYDINGLAVVQFRLF